MSALNKDTGSVTALLAGGAGLLLGLLANPARKLAVQAPTMIKGAWDEALAAEHKATLTVIDLIEKTSTDDTTRRAIHLAQLKHMIGKHSFQEENTVYATMRQRGLLEAAQHLNEDHGVDGPHVARRARRAHARRRDRSFPQAARSAQRAGEQRSVEGDEQGRPQARLNGLIGATAAGRTPQKNGPGTNPRPLCSRELVAG